MDSFDKDQKTIKTPGYPQEFKDTLCNWEIKPPKGTYVVLNRFEYNFGSWKTSCRGSHPSWPENSWQADEDECPCIKDPQCMDELIISFGDEHDTVTLKGDGTMLDNIESKGGDLYFQLYRNDTCSNTRHCYRTTGRKCPSYDQVEDGYGYYVCKNNESYGTGFKATIVELNCNLNCIF